MSDVDNYLLIFKYFIHILSMLKYYTKFILNFFLGNCGFIVVI